MTTQRERVKVIRIAQLYDCLVPLTTRSPAPPVNEQNRRALTQLKVLQFETVVFKERNGDLAYLSPSSIDDEDKPLPARDCIEKSTL